MKGAKLKLNVLVILLFFVAVFSGCTGNIKINDYQLPTADTIQINYKDLSEGNVAPGYSISYESYILVENSGDQAILELVTYNDDVEKSREHITVIKGENKIPLPNVVSLPIIGGQKVAFKLLKEGKEVGKGESIIKGDIPPRTEFTQENIELIEGCTGETAYYDSACSYMVTLKGKPNEVLINPLINEKRIYISGFLAETDDEPQSVKGIGVRNSETSLGSFKAKGIVQLFEDWMPGEFTYEVAESFLTDNYHMTTITEKGVVILLENSDEIREERSERGLPFTLGFDIMPTSHRIPYKIMEHSEVKYELDLTAANAVTKTLYVICEGSNSEPVCQLDKVV